MGNVPVDIRRDKRGDIGDMQNVPGDIRRDIDLVTRDILGGGIGTIAGTLDGTASFPGARMGPLWLRRDDRWTPFLRLGMPAAKRRPPRAKHRISQPPYIFTA